jgi:TonB family protein
MNGWVRAVLLAGLLGVLGVGCESVPKKPETRSVYASDGDVSAQQLQSPASERYPIESDVTYALPFPATGNAAPQYPEGLLSSRLPPITVQARLIVDEGGAVTDATIVEGGIPPAFAQSVRVAVQSWRFSPLKRRKEGKVEALPFSQQYTFTFRQVNGRAVVVEPVKSR